MKTLRQLFEEYKIDPEQCGAARYFYDDDTPCCPIGHLAMAIKPKAGFLFESEVRDTVDEASGSHIYQAAFFTEWDRQVSQGLSKKEAFEKALEELETFGQRGNYAK